MKLTVQALSAEAFAPYGDVLVAPEGAGRAYFEGGLGNSRPLARPSLSMVTRIPVAGLPLQVELLERHQHSSQTFVPIDVSRWLIVVCPHAPTGGPDAARAVAFVATGEQGVTYRADTWHHGLTVLDRPARFAVFMWRDGTTGDEEFVPVVPFKVEAPA